MHTLCVLSRREIRPKELEKCVCVYDSYCLEKSAHMNPMKFNRSKCKVLHLDWGNPRLGQPIGTSPVEKHFGVVMDEDKDMSQQLTLMAQKSNIFLVISKVGWPAAQGILPFHSALTRLHLECCIQLHGTEHKKDMVLLKQVQRRL